MHARARTHTHTHTYVRRRQGARDEGERRRLLGLAERESKDEYYAYIVTG